MISSSRVEEVASTRGDLEPKNMKEVNFEQVKDQMLKEMIFTGVSDVNKSGRHSSHLNLSAAKIKGNHGRISSLS
jgi:hypothetical protein